MKKKENEDEELSKLMKLTKLIKKSKVNVSKARKRNTPGNVWVNPDPKFAPPTTPSGEVVQISGIKVDPSLKDEYEAWQKEKEEERRFFREQKKKNSGPPSNNPPSQNI